MQDALIKMLLVVLGACLGASVTRYVGRRRTRKLIPLAMRQLDRAAELCATAFSAQESAAAAASLDLARQFAYDVVAAEVDAKDWAEGAGLIEEAQLAIRSVAQSGELATLESIERVRKQGKLLRAWTSDR